MAAGGTGTMTVEAAGATGYRWQRQVGTGPWSDVAGASGSVLAITATALAESGTSYRAVVTGPGGDAVSDRAVLTVRKARVSLRLRTPARVSAAKAAVVTVTWRTDGAPPRGKIVVMLGRKQVAKAVLRDGATKIRLPRLPRGRHVLVVRWRGSSTTEAARSAARRITVVR